MQRMDVGDDVIFAALVQGGEIHGEGALLAQVGDAAVKRAIAYVHGAGYIHRDGIFDRIVAIGVVPTEEPVPALSGTHG